MSRKQCKRKHYATGSAGVSIIHQTIFKASTADVATNEQTDILLPAYMALDNLRAGMLDSTRFIVLNESNCMTWQLGRQLAIHRGSAETGDLALMVKQRTEAAAEALAVIGERWRERGTFTALAAELEAIRQSVDLCRQLLAVMPKGMALTAMIDAEAMTMASMAQARKCA